MEIFAIQSLVKWLLNNVFRPCGVRLRGCGRKDPQIYAFLSFVCDIKIVVLDKSFYEIQIHNMLSIFNIVDKNIKELISNKKEVSKIDNIEDICFFNKYRVRILQKYE